MAAKDRKEASLLQILGPAVLLFVGIVAAWIVLTPPPNSGIVDPVALPEGPAIEPRAVVTLPEGGSISIGFTADSSAIITTGYEAPTEFRDSATGEVRAGVATPRVDLRAAMTVPFDADRSNISGPPKSTALSPDGTLLLTAGWNDPVAHLHNLADGSEVALAGHARAVSGVAFDPDGSRVATAAGDGTVRLWDLAGDNRAVLDAGDVILIGVLFSPDGSRIAGLTTEGVRLWDADTLDPVGSLLIAPGLREASFSPDGTRLLTHAGPVTSSSALLWNPTTGSLVATLPVAGNTVRSAAFSADGKTIVATAKGVEFFDSLTGARHADAGDWVARNVDGRSAEAAVLSPDGRLVVVSYAFDNGLRVIRVEDGSELAHLVNPGNDKQDPTISPDGRFVAARSIAALTIWDMPPYLPPGTALTAPAPAPAASPQAPE